MLPISHLMLCKMLMGMNYVGHFKEKNVLSVSKKSKNFMLLMFLPTYGRYFFFFSISTDMRPLLVIKETYTRVKGEKKAWSYYTLQLLKQILFTVSKSSVFPLQLCSKTN